MRAAATVVRRRDIPQTELEDKLERGFLRELADPSRATRSDCFAAAVDGLERELELSSGQRLWMQTQRFPRVTGPRQGSPAERAHVFRGLYLDQIEAHAPQGAEGRQRCFQAALARMDEAFQWTPDERQGLLANAAAWTADPNVVPTEGEVASTSAG